MVCVVATQVVLWPKLRNDMEDQETLVLYFPPLALYIYIYIYQYQYQYQSFRVYMCTAH